MRIFFEKCKTFIYVIKQKWLYLHQNKVRIMQIDTRNPEFQDALNLIQFTRQSVFLTGKAGTGKSTFLKYVCANVKKKHVVL